MEVRSGLRWLVLHLPAFRLERCGYGANDVVALIAAERGATRIVGLTPGALRVGIRKAMTATEARSLVPELELLPWDEAGEQADRQDLLRALEVVSDQLSAPWEDALLAEISRIQEPEGELAQRAVLLARSFGHRAKAAVADDPLAARAVTLWVAPDEGSVIVAQGEAARVLAPLPVQALAPDGAEPSSRAQTPSIEELFEALRAVGIETIGQWAALDPAAVAGRYGPLAGRLHRVARGGTTGLLARWARSGPRALPSVWTAMAGATTRQELAFVLPGLARELSAALAEQDQAAVRLRVLLKVEGGEKNAPVAAGVRLGRPTRSAKTLERLVAIRLERVTVGAPIEELGLEVMEAAPDGGWQPGLSDRAEAGEGLPELVARLADQLGDQALRAPVLQAVWRPESAWRAERYPRPPLLAARRLVRPDDPVEVLERWEASLPLPRPSILLPVPQPIEVICEGTRPVGVRLATGPGWRPVTRAAGPERLWGEWWSQQPLDREYWVIEADGRIWWVYREPLARDPTLWWAHGFFD